jgi:hypothetical protein
VPPRPAYPGLPGQPVHLPSYPYPGGVRYPGAWVAAGIATTAWWAGAAWGSIGSYCGCSDQPYSYAYGETITYNDGTVYYGDQPVASAEQYYDQANQLAAEGQQASDEEWLPLGVFGVVRQREDAVEKVVQIAVNKDGVIRGNYHDLLADKVTPILGSVNRENQRVAMKLEGNAKLVFETGLYNLTSDEVPLMVHFGPDVHEPRTLIRLQRPEGDVQQSTAL